MRNFIYLSFSLFCSSLTIAAEKVILAKIDYKDERFTRIYEKIQFQTEFENLTKERLSLFAVTGAKPRGNFTPLVGKYASFKINPDCFPEKRDENTPDVPSRSEFLDKVSLILSFNWEVQLNLEVAEEIAKEYKKYLQPIEIFQKFDRSLNVFSNPSLADYTFPAELNYDHVVGRCFAMKQKAFRGYQDIRKCFFNKDYLIAGNLAPLQGFLISPKSSKAKSSPAVVILPSTTNIGSSELSHAETLARNGMIVFVVDPYYSGNKVGGLDNPLESLLENELMVAFAAKHLLSTHPQVNPRKIGVGGFSRGGTTADMCSRKEIYQTLSHDKAPFAFHFAYYPTIIAQQIDLKVAGPLLYLAGDKDEFVDIDSMKSYCQRLEEAGIISTLVVYKNSYHGFDNPEEPHEPTVSDFPVLSMKNAGVAYDVVKGFVPLIKGKMPEQPLTSFVSWDMLFDYLGQNIRKQYTSAHNPKHTQHAMQRVIKFIKASTNQL